MLCERDRRPASRHGLEDGEEDGEVLALRGVGAAGDDHRGGGPADGGGHRQPRDAGDALIEHVAAAEVRQEKQVPLELQELPEIQVSPALRALPDYLRR